MLRYSQKPEYRRIRLTTLHQVRPLKEKWNFLSESLQTFSFNSPLWALSVFICFGSVYITYYKIAHLYFQTPNYRKNSTNLWHSFKKGVEKGVRKDSSSSTPIDRGWDFCHPTWHFLRCINGWGSRNSMPLVSRCGCEVLIPVEIIKWQDFDF